MQETDDEIIAATYRVLCEHGYADLTVGRIAEEADMTTAAIHYHFDTKADLLTAFLAHVVERFESRLPAESVEPRRRLVAFLDAVFAPAADRDDDFPVALMELKAQAPYQQGYRERLQMLDDRMRSVVAAAVRDGIESGVFPDDADPETIARFVVTAINGGHARRVALGEDPEHTRQVVEAYLQTALDWRPEVAV